MKKGLTQIVFVLDMSGSMSPLTMETSRIKKTNE